MPAGGLAARSVNVLFQGRFPLSRLHAPVSLGDCMISRRTAMNNVGYALNELPHPQVVLACGFLIEKPEPCRLST
jgi:hypothetical protein